MPLGTKYAFDYLPIVPKGTKIGQITPFLPTYNPKGIGGQISITPELTTHLREKLTIKYLEEYKLSICFF